jgi:predicted metalloprotease
MGAGGVSVGGLALYVLFRLFGGDPSTLRNGPSTFSPSPVQESPGMGTSTALGGSCAGMTAAVDQAKFISCVVSNVQAFWRRTLPGYRTARLVLFTEETPSGCGVASAETGPFYCPEDHEVYLDLGFFEELHSRLGAKGGDFAEAYVVAHEYGHHIQSLEGIERKYEATIRESPSSRNRLSVRLELQADCYAGVWGSSAYAAGKVAPSEIGDAMDAAAAVGDDRIQRELSGHVHPEKFTHGTSAERQRWFKKGLSSGNIDACDTFGEQL